MAYRNQLVVRQVIGRTLLDTEKDGHAFEIIPHDELWMVCIYGMCAEDAQQIINLISDCNLIYTEFENEQWTEKWWLYSIQMWNATYAPEEMKLVLLLDTRVCYQPQILIP